MGARPWRLCSLGGLLLTLGACSAGGGPDTSEPSDPAGAIELAVSQTCTPDQDPRCVSVNGEHVVVAPSEFVRAGVEEAAVADHEEGNSAVDVIFDDDGAAVFQDSTAQVAQAGQAARLVTKVGDQVIAAVRVPEALDGDRVRVALPADARAEDVVDLITGD